MKNKQVSFMITALIAVIMLSMTDCNRKNEQASTDAEIAEASQTSAALPAYDIKENIEGHYTNIEDYMTTVFDVVELTITKDGNAYKYEMNTPNNNFKGKISFSDDPEYFTLEGIRWVSWEIGGIQQELPEGVNVYIYDESELVIQNYGNSDNNYVIFDDIEEKYIRLIKRDF
jgi:hypothetical protein